MDSTQLDPESRAQLRIIAIETSIEELKARLKELEKTVIEPYLQGFETRVKVLEDARQVQRQLNVEYSKFLEKLVEAKKPVGKSKWW